MLFVVKHMISVNNYIVHEIMPTGGAFIQYVSYELGEDIWLEYVFIIPNFSSMIREEIYSLTF